MDSEKDMKVVGGGRMQEGWCGFGRCFMFIE